MAVVHKKKWLNTWVMAYKVTADSARVVPMWGESSKTR